MRNFSFLFFVSVFVSCTNSFANGSKGDSSFIFHHIGDDYRMTFFETEKYNAAIYLPVILISKGGLEVFSSKNFYNSDGSLNKYNGYFINEHNKIESEDGKFFIDISITKNVFFMFISMLFLLLIFFVCRLWYFYYKDNEAPSGFIGMIECVFLYICNDVLIPNLGDKYKKYLPYLMTLFFFILINNLLGLLPGAANVTGNISVTACLAFLTFLCTNLNASKHYWHHIFMPDVPKFLYPIMIPIEAISIFTKPFTLLIRLFANITSGHIILLSIINLAFVFQSYAVGVAGVFISTFMILLKLIVAFLQAYIFTLLSAIYIGGAIEKD